MIVVPCGNRKLASSAAAADLYQGPYFGACLKWARSNVSDDQIRILSGKYGFLRLDRVIAPYNAKLKGSLTAEQIEILRATSADIEPDALIVGGRNYYRAARIALPNARWLTPRMGLRHTGMGYQLQWLKMHNGMIP